MVTERVFKNLAAEKDAKVRLSVLVSCYQNTTYFLQMLQSYERLFKGRTDVELLICDDGCQEQVGGDIARLWAKTYPGPVTVFYNAPNRGIQYAYQKLAASARGTYLMPFDCDDLFFYFDVEAAMLYLDTHLEYAGSYGKKRLFSGTKGDLEACHGANFSYFAMAFNTRLVHNAMLLRKEDFWQVNGYCNTMFKHPIKGPVDCALFIALSLYKPLYFDNSYRALYRIYPKQYTQTQTQSFKAEQAYERQCLKEAYPKIYKVIIQGDSYALQPKEKPLAVMLLGVYFYESTSKTAPQDMEKADTIIRKLEIAKTIMPEDYALWEYQAKLLLHIRQYAEAEKVSKEMYELFKGKPYIELQALGLWQYAAERQGKKSASLDQSRKQALSVFMQIPILHLFKKSIYDTIDP